AVKAHDGGDVWSQFNPTLVSDLRAAGLKVLAWGYCYGGGATWTELDEMLAADRVIAIGCDGYIADVEAEYEGKPEQADTFARGVKQACDKLGIPFAYAPLP